MNVRIFESVQWNACVHRLGFSLYSHPKEFLENGVRTLQEKNPLYWKKKKKKTQRRIEPTTLHQAEQGAQQTTTELFRPPSVCVAVCLPVVQSPSVRQWSPQSHDL